MANKEFEITKLYWSISEIAIMFDVNQSLVRFWEREFDELKPKKNQSGNRLFTKNDIAVFQHIYRLVKEEGMTLEGAKKKLKEMRKRELITVQKTCIENRLLKLRNKLLMAKEELLKSSTVK